MINREAIQADQQDQREFWSVIFKDALRIGDYRIAELKYGGGWEIWALLKDGAYYPDQESFPTLQGAVTYCVKHTRYAE